MYLKTAYLTIDDGPSKDMKKKVDFLISKGISAVWFCRGDLLEQRPHYADYAIKNRFIISNHSYSHPYFSDLTLRQCYEEIERTDTIIEYIYQKAAVKRPAKFFRFPYGDKGGLRYAEVFEPYQGEGKIRKDGIQEFLRRLGCRQPRFMGITYEYYLNAGLLDDVDWHWTYDVMEYAIFEEEHMFGIDSLEKVFERMDEDVPEGCRGLNFSGSEDIILIHDHPESSHLFEPIVERLLAKGIQFSLPEFDHE